MSSRCLRVRAVAFWFCLLLAQGCAKPPEPTSSSSSELAAERNAINMHLFRDVIEEKARLLNIEYVLNRAAVKACGDLARPQFGILTGSQVSLGQTSLQEATANDGFLRNGLTIVYVVPGSSFDRAGLRAGDELLALNGKSPKSHSELHAQRMQTTQREQTVVRYRREGREHDIAIRTRFACPVTFSLFDSESIVTRSQPAHVLVPRGLLAFAHDEQILANALAHGFAHAVWDEVRDSPLEQESRADELGIRLAAHAGFDVHRTIRYWEDVARVHPWLVTPNPIDEKVRSIAGFAQMLERMEASSHPGIAVRMDGIRAAVKNQAGE